MALSNPEYDRDSLLDKLKELRKGQLIIQQAEQSFEADYAEAVAAGDTDRAQLLEDCFAVRFELTALGNQD